MGEVYLIPSQLSEDGMAAVHPYTMEAIKNCQVFFCENLRTTRRFFKSLWKQYAPGSDIIIDDYEWHELDDKQESVNTFRSLLNQDINIGIVSEAGCPGVADPGQLYIAIAQEQDIRIRPLVGPSSILLALMASGMNGQHFQFIGYLPISQPERIQAIKSLETYSSKNNCTQIFIETPYRNNQLFEILLKTCQPSTRLCIAVDITGMNESIRTKTIGEWKKEKVELHKRTVIFLVDAGS
jgi:16S rRNA (cytidine1402-2'-O)-methyltransferase